MNSIVLCLCVLMSALVVSAQGAIWSAWTPWNTCPVSCNVGLVHRDRQCIISRDISRVSVSEQSDFMGVTEGLFRPRLYPIGTSMPEPSSLSDCVGPNREYQLCNTEKCPDPIVFFSVGRPQELMDDNVVIFTKTIDASSVNDFNSTIGKFTCTIPGLYHFSVTFNSHLLSGSDKNTYCFILKNDPRNAAKAEVHTSAFGKSGSDNNWRSASADVYLSLVKGDTVWVGGCAGWGNIKKHYWFRFNGALITAA